MSVRRSITSGPWSASLDVDETAGEIMWIFHALDDDDATTLACTPLNDAHDLLADVRNAFSAYQALARAVSNDTLNEVERIYEGITGSFSYRTGPYRGLEFLVDTEGFPRRIHGPFDFNCVTEILEEALRLEPELRAIARLDI